MEKCRLTQRVVLVVSGAFLAVNSVVVGQSLDPVVQFYRNRARLVCAERHPVEQALVYSFRATTYLKKLGNRGAVTSVDTAITDFFFSGGTLDSQRTVESVSNKELSNVDFFYPNVFDSDYRFTFYPNDTGGKYLTIGFDSDSLGDPRSVGLAVIDRYDYHLYRLYLFYPHKPGYKRFSRTLHFAEHEGYIFPDSIVEVVARPGIFSDDNHRLETIISNIRVYH